MRISPSELQTVDRGGLLTRFAILGPVAFVMATLPDTGTTGTGLDSPCLTEHHGLVVRGSFSVHHEDGRTETFVAGDAFYVPPGPPSHVFTGSPGCVVEGFAPVPPTADVSDSALESLGFARTEPAETPVAPPTSIVLRGSVRPFRKTGTIDVEGSAMGPWLFVRARFAPRAGYTSGWCDLTHWGVVLDGVVAINHPDRTELLGRGDIYLGLPGHRFTSPDGATLVDYTPMDQLQAARVPRWRRAAMNRAAQSVADGPAAGDERMVLATKQRYIPDGGGPGRRHQLRLAPQG